MIALLSTSWPATWCSSTSGISTLSFPRPRACWFREARRRSTFSFGLPILGATRSDNAHVADSQFISWLGQVKYVHRLGPMPAFFGALTGQQHISAGDAQLVFRVAGQLSNSPLLDVEQFVVGGVDTVRGYPENTLVRDQGIAGSVELHLPIIPGRTGEPERLAFVPFFDAGYARDLVVAGNGLNKGEDLNSVGIGLLCNPDRRVNLQFYYGYALTHRAGSHRDPQDLGIHFSISVNAF